MLRPPPPSFATCLQAIRQPALYRNFLIHVFVMFPAAMLICAIGRAVDQRLELVGPFATGAGRALGLSCLLSGGAWVWYVYGYLFLLGEGSPGTHVDGGPTRLVDTGPYTVVRHPSVIGKFLAVTGLGVLWNSPTFLLGFLPVLLLYSIVTNRWIQERFCDLRFGARYAQYRQHVPMLLPQPSGLRRWWRGEAALPDVSEDRAVQPPEIRMEFRYYLMGLALLVLLFGGVLAGLS